MDALGMALVTGGFAFLISGLIFLLPARRKRSAQRELVDEDLDKADTYMRDARRARRDLS